MSVGSKILLDWMVSNQNSHRNWREKNHLKIDILDIDFNRGPKHKVKKQAVY